LRGEGGKKEGRKGAGLLPPEKPSILPPREEKGGVEGVRKKRKRLVIGLPRRGRGNLQERKKKK